MNKKRNKGFTLIELLVVVAIIGILAAVGVVAYSGYTAGAKKQAAKSNQAAVTKYIAAELQKCNMGEADAMSTNLSCSGKTPTTVITAAAKDFGLQIEDVRIRRADLPTANSDAIFRRMQTERQQEAAQYRAEGEEQSRILKAQAEKEKTILLADAERTSDILRGEGDGEKNKILGEAFSKDPEFFSFYRSMQAYINAISAEDTTMILSHDSTFFEYFDKIDKLE